MSPETKLGPMQEDGFDLDAYLDRIGAKAGPPSEVTLDEIVRAHARAIPFENLDIHRGLPIRLDLASLMAKLVHARRGGYCFEHNTLLRRVLEELGFSVRALAARVRYLGPAPLPRTHMLLLVDIGPRTLLADVGFGGRNLREPIPFEIGPTIVQGRESYRFEREDEVVVLRSVLPDGERDLYAFGLERQHAIDFEMASWFTSTHPTSRFVQKKVAARVADGVRVSLVDRELRRVVTRADGREDVSVRELAPGPEWLTVVREELGIQVPDDPPIRWS